jgi:hypothetical protein
LSLKVSTRDIPPYRDPAVILIDQLKEIYIDAELEPIETTGWYPKVMRKDYTIGLNLTGNGMDDPAHSSPHFAPASNLPNSPLLSSISANRCISGSRRCSGMFGISS